MQGPALVSIPAMWECGTVPSPMDTTQPSTIPSHANTVPTPTKTSPMEVPVPVSVPVPVPFQALLPSPLLNWRPNVPPPVLPPPPVTPTHNNSSPVNTKHSVSINNNSHSNQRANNSASPQGLPTPAHAIHMQQKALLRAHQGLAQHGGAAVRQAPSELLLRDFDTIDEYVAYLEREVGRVELVSFRVRTPDGRLTLFESEIPMRRRSIASNSGLKVEVDCCAADAEDVAERNLAEWEERDMELPRTAMSMPDMRHYRQEVLAITEPGAQMIADASFRSSATSFAAVAYHGHAIPHTVQGVPLMSPPSASAGSLQSLVAAANMPSPQQPLLNMRTPFAPPLSPSNVLPPTPPNNPARAKHVCASATAPAGTPASSSTTPTANLLTPPDSPDFAEGSESPNSGCSTELDGDDDSAVGQRTSFKPSLPGCQHSAYWKRLRHKKGTTHFLCVLCGCKWRRVSRDGEEE